MTRKEYERAATLVRQVALSHRLPEAALVATVFELFFEGDNHRFDRVRFREACFPGQTVKAVAPAVMASAVKRHRAK